MSDKIVKGVKRLNTANTMANAVKFMVEQTVSGMVETAEVVGINAADQTGTGGAAGYASATPLVAQTDAWHNTLPQAPLHALPYLRPQAGKAAIVMDPQPGDKAVLLALKRDSSGVVTGKSEQVQPASFRTFDLAGGYLINGFLGEAPEIWLHLNPVSGDISLSTKAANIDISCREEGDIVVKTGSGNVTIQAGSGGEGTITLDGQVVVTRNIIVQNKNNEAGGSQFTGGFNNTGGKVTSNTVSLESHTHKGVQTGGSSTGGPNGGT